MAAPTLALCQKPVCKLSAVLTVTLIINSISLAGITRVSFFLFVITGQETPFLQMFLGSVGYSLVGSCQIPEEEICRGRDQGEVETVEVPAANRCLPILSHCQVLSKENK